jgi:hypothetical protein
MTLDIQSAKYFSNGGYPTLGLVVNGKTVLLDRHNRNSLSEDGYISLGIEFEDDDSIPELQVPPKPEIGRGSMVLQGFTRDARVQRLFQQFLADVDGGRFTEKPLPLN